VSYFNLIYSDEEIKVTSVKRGINKNNRNTKKVDKQKYFSKRQIHDNVAVIDLEIVDTLQSRIINKLKHECINLEVDAKAFKKSSGKKRKTSTCVNSPGKVTSDQTKKYEKYYRSSSQNDIPTRRVKKRNRLSLKMPKTEQKEKRIEINTLVEFRKKITYPKSKYKMPHFGTWTRKNTSSRTKKSRAGSSASVFATQTSSQINYSKKSIQHSKAVSKVNYAT
jgi:hypothetical protein